MSSVSAGLVVISPEALAELVKEAVISALAEFEEGRSPAPALVGPSELATLLDTSRSMVHRLRTEGMPSVRVGDVHKYEPAAVMAWLRERDRCKP